MVYNNMYPWLYSLYRKIISFNFRIKNLYFNLIINFSVELGVDNLIFYISKWLFCENLKDNCFCDVCMNCNLLNDNNHPDFYFIRCKNKNICINKLEYFKKKFFCNSYISKFKIVYFSNTNFLTSTSFNSLLKLIEEPPYKIIFIFTCLDSINIPPTIYSRCFYYKLYVPKEKNIISWVKKHNILSLKDISIITAVRLCNYSPIISLDFIKHSWERRLYFINNIYDVIFDSFEKINIFFCDNDFLEKINWLCILLMDIIRYNINNVDDICNVDKLNLIHSLNKKIFLDNIFLIINKIFFFRKNILSVYNFNKNILISNLSFYIYKYINI